MYADVSIFIGKDHQVCYRIARRDGEQLFAEQSLESTMHRHPIYKFV